MLKTVFFSEKKEEKGKIRQCTSYKSIKGPKQIEHDLKKRDTIETIGKA